MILFFLSIKIKETKQEHFGERAEAQTFDENHLVQTEILFMPSEQAFLIENIVGLAYKHNIYPSEKLTICDGKS